MKLPFLSNLSRRDIAGYFDPAEGPCPPSPPGGFVSKDDYRAWCVNRTTNHRFLTNGIGLNASLRTSKQDNPIVRLACVIGEFDAKTTQLDLAEAPFQPNWVCRTYSGNLRMFWELPETLPLDNEEHRTAFLRIFFKEVKAVKLAAGFALEESLDCYHHYEIGYNWIQVSAQPTIAAATLQGWMFRACENRWPAERTQIEFESVRKECAARWPNCGVHWETWAPGVRCHRFWDPNADADSAVVSEHGVRCWTGDKVFVSWSDILGADWVRSQTDVMLGSSVQGWYWESKTGKYWTQLGAKDWHPFTSGDFRLRASAMGLSETRPKSGGPSQVDKAQLMVQDTAAVHGIFPAFFNQSKVVDIAGLKYLNTTTVQVLQPEPAPCAWGEGFEWTADYFERLFDVEQRFVMLHWLACYYKQAINGTPNRGVASFMAGGVGVGKTFFNRQILHRLFGGSMDASHYLTGADQFNSNLVAAPVWTVDDAVFQGTAQARERYSQMIKMATSNEGIVMRGMHREGFRAPWFGRISVTMNADPDSLKLLPTTDISIKDKIQVLKARDTKLGPGQWASDDKMSREIKCFAAYLRDLPEDPVFCGGRFGTKPYLDRDLIEDSESASNVAGTKEILEAWANRYFEDRGAGVFEWVGTATQLFEAVSAYEAISDALKRQTKSVSHLQHDLRKLFGSGWDKLSEVRNGGTRTRAWKIVK